MRRGGDGRSCHSGRAACARRQQQRLQQWQQQQQQQQAEWCRSNGKAPRNGKGKRAQAALCWLHGNAGPMPEGRHGSAVAVPPRATSLVVDLIPCRNLASWNGAWVGLWVIHRQRLSVASRLWWAGAEHSLVLGAACVTSQRRTAATRVTWGWAGVGLMWITFSAGLPQCGCSGLPLSAGECLGTRLAGTCSARLVHRGCCENGLARWFVRVCHVHAQFPWTIEARSLLTVTMFADDDDEYYDANDDNG